MADDDGGTPSDDDGDEFGDDAEFDEDDDSNEAGGEVAGGEGAAGTGEPGEATTTQAAAPKKRSVRNVPREPLGASVGHIDKLFDAFGEGASLEALAVLLGHDAPRGGAWKTRIGTLRAYGLLSGGDPVELTEIGQDVVRDDQPEVQLRARRRALVASAPFRELHETYVGRPLPDEEHLATKCRFAFRLKQDGALEVARVFASSLNFAGLIGAGGMVLPLDAEEPAEAPEGDDHTDGDDELEVDSGGAREREGGPVSDESDGESSLPADEAGSLESPSTADGGSRSRDLEGGAEHDGAAGGASQPSVEMTVKLVGYSGSEVVRILRTIGYGDASG